MSTDSLLLSPCCKGKSVYSDIYGEGEPKLPICGKCGKSFDKNDGIPIVGAKTFPKDTICSACGKEIGPEGHVCSYVTASGKYAGVVAYIPLPIEKINKKVGK